MPVTNVDIIEEFKKGTSKGFSGIYNLYFGRIYQFAVKLLGNSEDAKDITITSFNKLFERFGNFVTEDNIRAFLYVATRNACFNFLKQKKTVVANEATLDYLAEESKGVEPDIIEGEYVRLIYKAIERLPRVRKKVFELMYIQGLSISEIAKQLDLSVKTVKNYRGLAIDNIKAFINSLEK